jgi:hypothetical protein
MNIHPVSTLSLLLAMVSAFGLTDALMATPLAAIIKPYYEEFYVSKFNEDKLMDNKIDALLYQKKEKQKAIENLYEITDQNTFVI